MLWYLICYRYMGNMKDKYVIALITIVLINVEDEVLLNRRIPLKHSSCLEHHFCLLSYTVRLSITLRRGISGYFVLPRHLCIDRRTIAKHLQNVLHKAASISLQAPFMPICTNTISIASFYIQHFAESFSD